MKIGFVFDDSLDRPDGVQQYVLTLGEWLRGRGHDVHYLTGQTVRTDIAGIHSLGRNVTVRFNGNRLSIPLPVSRRAIRRMLEAEKFDVLHVQMPYSPMLAQRVIMQAPAGTAIFGTFHILPQSGFVNLATGFLRLLLRPSLGRFTRVYAVSSSARAFAQRAFKLNTVDILPNIVNVKLFQSPAPAHASVPVVMFLGRLVPRKGCQVFLQAVAALRQRHHEPFRVLVCGKGPLATELQAQSKQLRIDDITEFTGFVPEADKPGLLAAATVAAYPSIGGESFGIVLLEAMAAGRGDTGPVVLAASNPGYATVMQPRPRQMFAPGDAEALAGLMATYLSDATAMTEARRWQQAYIRQFDVAVVGQRLLAAYTAHLRKQAQP